MRVGKAGGGGHIKNLKEKKKKTRKGKGSLSEETREQESSDRHKQKPTNRNRGQKKTNRRRTALRNDIISKWALRGTETAKRNDKKKNTAKDQNIYDPNRDATRPNGASSRIALEKRKRTGKRNCEGCKLCETEKRDQKLMGGCWGGKANEKIIVFWGRVRNCGQEANRGAMRKKRTIEGGPKKKTGPRTAAGPWEMKSQRKNLNKKMQKSRQTWTQAGPSKTIDWAERSKKGPIGGQPKKEGPLKKKTTWERKEGKPHYCWM